MPTSTNLLDNILDSVKKGLGIQPSDTTFDGPITNDINSVLMILNQMGFGPTGFVVDEDHDQLWSEFLVDEEDKLYPLVKTYTVLKVRQMFDPPSTGYTTESMDRQIQQFEYRLVAQKETTT